MHAIPTRLAAIATFLAGAAALAGLVFTGLYVDAPNWAQQARGTDLATLVEVTFSEAPDGGTHVDLLHTGWAVHGAEAAAWAAEYQQGWTALLEGFAKAA